MYPSLGVVITTYNHEKFLGECLESVLTQDYAGDFKIYVGEDCSPDSTAKILKQYADKYPDKIVPIFREKNIGGHKNFQDTLGKCDAEWVAWLEGDDFWYDKSKLTKQMNALKAHPESTICFGMARALDLTGIGFSQGKVFAPDFISETYERNDLLRRNFIPTCTVIFKKNTVYPLPHWYENWHLGDWTLYLQALKHGNAVFINEVLSVYRVHAGGVWSHINAAVKLERQENLINFLISIEESNESKKHLYFNLFTQQLALIFVYLREKKLSLAVSKMVSLPVTFFKAKWTMKGFGAYLNHAKKLLKNIF